MAKTGFRVLRAYYQAVKPERTYANVLTTLAGLLFASKWHAAWGLLLATIGGTTLLVMSACAANNCTDRSIDARMSRTRQRALVTGVLPVRNVAILALVLGLAGLVVLALWVNWLTLLVGVVAYVDYVVLYAWSKRTTPWSTLIGTISGAAPLMAGYTAITNHFDTTALLLGLIMVFWQMVHFYAIGIFRRQDYAAAKLPVWTVVYGVRNTQAWMIAYTVLFVLGTVALATLGHAGWIFGGSLGVAGLYWLYKGVRGLAVVQPERWARGMFGNSLVVLLVLSAALAVGPVLP